MLRGKYLKCLKNQKRFSDFRNIVHFLKLELFHSYEAKGKTKYY